ncbi:mycofactocin-coupled SDR family oxidoreductase [Nocardia harenae]|uniref:mycofactocin-coupled SDR family oxidoreductase n=1 Tax=Nocardia harenae TaxID=358707 RepID=UPI000835981A|nr:mycofactocin-coupled SDR family oxidoreductase [Nocardia harenae]
MARVAGKTVLISGVARGQGRAHAVRLAEEGADIIGFDLCADIASNNYPLATPDDLAETVRLVERTGRRIIAEAIDVRDRVAVERFLDRSVTELGGLDVVVANAGICPLGLDRPLAAFVDSVDVDLVGVVNTVHAALTHLTPGGSVIVIGSVAGLLSAGAPTQGPQGPGGAGYSLSKRFVIDYVNTLAVQLAPSGTRCNAVHPTNCDTVMLQNDALYRTFRPDLERPTPEQAAAGFRRLQAIPVPWVEPDDVAHAVVYLASDESRYVTGMQMKIDAGAIVKQGR